MRASEMPSRSHRTLTWLVRQLMPTLVSVLLVLVLLMVFPSLAAPFNAINAASISTIPHQGRLANAAGEPPTDMVNMEFRLFDVPTGGTPLWIETWAMENSVRVTDGLFSVMPGSLNTNLASVVQSHSTLYLGLAVGAENEMTPRVQLGSVPFSIGSLTIADNSIATVKIANGAVIREKSAANAVAQPMQWGNIIPSASSPNYPTSYEWVDIQELQAIVKVVRPSVVFVVGRAFFNGDSTEICVICGL